MPRPRTVYLVDGSGQFYRAFHAIRGLATSRGLPTNATYGFTTMLRKLLHQEARKLGLLGSFGGRRPSHSPLSLFQISLVELADRLNNEANPSLPKRAGKILHEHAAANAYMPDGGGCVECHDPHPGLVRTVYTGISSDGACLKCHGDAGTMSEQVRREIAAAYPNDRATGYKAGDFRGIISVFVK